MSRTTTSATTNDGGTTVAARADGADQVDLALVLRILRTQWTIIALCLAVFLGAAMAYSVLSPKVWRASARVLLDPRDKQIVGNDVARQAQGTELGWVETRLELVKSYDTLAAAVAKEKLVDDDEILSAGERASADPVAAAVRNLAERVLVERPKENNLIDVTVSSKTPEKAARLANAVAQAFVDGLARAKVDQVEHANDLLSRQIDEMRSKMLEAEARVEEYKRNNGIAMTRGNLVEEETLRQSNEMLVAARTKTQEARERSERLAQLLKSGDPTILSQTDSIGSAVISRLKIEAANAMRRKSELEQTLGPRHPRVAAATAEVDRARQQVADEVKSLAATAALDYQVARANEDNARKALERAQAHLADASQATVGMQEMENEANARRELYKSFVSRMEETTLQRNTQVSDARIVSPAQIPLKPFSPRTTLALALAAVAGLGLGISLALYRGRSVLAAVTTTERRPDETAPAPAPEVAPPAEAVARVVAPTVEPVIAAPEAPTSAAAIATVAPVPPRAEEPAETTRAARRAARASEDATPDRPARRRTRRAAGGFREATFAIGLDAIARLGAADGPGAGIGALSEAPDGHPDDAALDRLDALGHTLRATDRAGVCVVFSNTVPTLITASLCLGLARSGEPHAATNHLVDLAHEAAPFDALFERGHAVAPIGLPGEEDWERVGVAETTLLRPLDPPIEGDGESHPDGLGALLAALRRHGDRAIVHLGRQPTAALLFEVAEVADHVVLVADATDLEDRRTADEIAVMKSLLPHFDGMVVLGRDASEDAVLRRAARRRRAVSPEA